MSGILSLVLALGAVAAPAQQAGTSTKKKASAKASTSSISAQLDRMQQAIDAQQKQIEELRQQLQNKISRYSSCNKNWTRASRRPLKLKAGDAAAAQSAPTTTSGDAMRRGL